MPDEDDDEVGPIEPSARGVRPPGEGVRIIGAEEAAAALEAGQVAGRRPPEAPRRFGHPVPPPEGPPPAMTFPLDPHSSLDEPTVVARPAYPSAPPDAGYEDGYGDSDDDAGVARVDSLAGGAPEYASVPAPELPHWTEPPTGEVPQILPGTDPNDRGDESWAGFTRAPRWRDHGDEWHEDEFGDASVLADDETRLGALDTSRSEHSDLFTFDDPEPDFEPVDAPMAPTRIRSRAEAEPPEYAPVHSPRDNRAAVLIGGALGIAFLLLAKAGPGFLLAYSTAVVVLCAGEVFAVLRRAGYRPATLLGIVATVSMMIGLYFKGERALGLVMVLMIVFTMLWYLSGVISGRATINVAATVLGFAWTGFLGGFAALLLRPASYANARGGVALLVAVVVCTVANDVGAYLFGRTFGRTPLAPTISPNKTLEGYLGGMFCTVLVGAGLISRIHPIHSTTKGFFIGLVIAIVAPLGDLCESMIKRDLGVKDMGSLLPGHGGVMDRFDALLFALPATYYLAQVLHIL